MQSDGLWNGQRGARGQHLRKKNQGTHDFKKTYNVLVRLRMPHWSDCLKKTISVNPVKFSGTFVILFLPCVALVLFRDCSNSLYFSSYSGVSPCKMDCH